MADEITPPYEAKSLNVESKSKDISIRENPCFTERYWGEKDPDPNQVECFLTNPNEAEKDVNNEICNRLLCQICNAIFKGSCSRHNLLEHINSIHSFDIFNKGHRCHACNLVFYTLKAFETHKNICEKKSTSIISIETHSLDGIKEIVAIDHEKSKSNARTAESDAKIKEEDGNEDASFQSDFLPDGRDVKDNSFKCYICSTILRTTRDFTSHLLSRHKREISELEFDDLSYRCKKCTLTFPNLLLLRSHFFKKHTTLVIYRCIVCHVTLRSKKSLKIHFNNAHAQKTKELQPCDECGKELSNLRALKAHIRLKHSPNNNKQGFRCRLCKQKFDSKESRKVHYEEHHLGESPFVCTDCGKGFSSKSGLYGHRQLHKTDKSSTCPYCEKIFNRRDSYHEHILIHVGPKHRCPHCPKEFVQRSNLVRHIRIHTGQKPYTCTFCDKRFSDKGACNSHIRVHTKEEQCVCSYCGQTFTKKQKLKYHIRKHTGEGLLSCEICSKSFTNSFALKEHRAIHDRQTQTICIECGKAFNSAKYLQRHVALVHQEAPRANMAIRCPVCGKVFCHEGRLKSHLVTHLGKKHLQCLICEKRYSSMKSVRNHLQQSHNLMPDQPEFSKYVRSAFENDQTAITPQRLSLLCSSSDEKISSKSSIKLDQQRSSWNKDTFTGVGNDGINRNERIVKDEISFTQTEGILNYNHHDKLYCKTELNTLASTIHADKFSHEIKTEILDIPEEMVLQDEITHSFAEKCSSIGEEPTKVGAKMSMNEQTYPKWTQSNLSAIIEERMKVNEELSRICEKQINPVEEQIPETEDIRNYFQEMDQESKLDSKYSKEINRRRKQMRTPKKYVSTVDTGLLKNNLNIIVPKRERVEAIARSLKKSTNTT
ncbi:zinc finger protein 595 isoform X1 [Neodiprion lecontei]|uniref:Zinc finger protein 595 isoform X1 n=1 Tax=Neodiprion lecontei TaxID=441921 RepID=A0A6J0BVU7_NEOLC|nr:zinc finger protein 595 isoform X1 [Neodiprion lecontei]XP_046587296.1 zinc finger protein 595 isoform X1 [Neodiprion lecontei]